MSEVEDEFDGPDCCRLNEDGYALAHVHADGRVVPCAPISCPGCMNCDRFSDD